MCSCQGLAKLILVLFNLIFLLAGMLMLAIGIIVQTNPEYIFTILGRIPGMSKVPAAFDLGGIFTASAIFMIILGAVVAAVGFFGCCGACCESRELLCAYIVVLVVVLLAQLALIILAVVAPEKLKGTIADAMNKSMERFKEDITLFDNGTLKLPNDPVSLGWTFLQIGASCCGTYNHSDYSNWHRNVTINGKTHNATVPISCCAKEKDMDMETSKRYDDTTFKDLIACLDGNNDYINQKNCFDSVFDIILQSQGIVIGIASGIIGVEVLLINLAVIMRRKNKYN